MVKYESISYQKKMACKIVEIEDSEDNLFGIVDYHYHRSLEILFPIKGGLYLSNNGESVEVQSNVAYLINSKNIHSVRPFFEDKKYHGFFFQISHEMLSYCYPNYDELYFDNRLIDQEILKNLLFNMIDVKKKQDSFYILEITKYTIELMKLLLITASRKKINPTLDYQKKIVIEVIEYIKRNFRTRIKISELASKFHYSYGYLEKIFKDNTGITIQDYLNFIRLQHAEIALINTFKTTLEISEECGFSNLKSMQRCFKEYHLLTPNEYRKKMRKRL